MIRDASSLAWRLFICNARNQAYKSGMDKLNELIEEKKREVAVLKRYAANPNLVESDLGKATAALEAFETAASLWPLPNGAAPPAAPSGATCNDASDETDRESNRKRGGKPKGAISAEWKSLLGRMYADGNPYRADDWVLVAAKKAKIISDPKSIKDRLYRKYVGELKFLEYQEGHGLRVTPMAVARFKFDKEAA
jgi:hypothetical protein